MLNLIYQHCVSFVMIINSSHIKTTMTFFFQNIHELKTTYKNCYLYTQLYRIQHHHNWEYTFPYYYTTENRIIWVLWENLMSCSYPKFSKTPSCLKTWHAPVFNGNRCWRSKINKTIAICPKTQKKNKWGNLRVYFKLDGFLS